MNSQALQQSESDNRRSHRVGLLGLVMFNGIIHLTCVLNNLHQICILCDTCNTQVHFIQFQPALMEVIYNFACCITLGTPNTLYTLFLHTWHLVGWMGPISIHHFCASWIHWLYEHLIKQPHMYTTPRQHYRPSRQKSTFSQFTGLRKIINHLSPSLSLPVLLAASAASPSCPAQAQWGSALGWWGCAGNQRQWPQQCWQSRWRWTSCWSLGWAVVPGGARCTGGEGCLYLCKDGWRGQGQGDTYFCYRCS